MRQAVIQTKIERLVPKVVQWVKEVFLVNRFLLSIKLSPLGLIRTVAGMTVGIAKAFDFSVIIHGHYTNAFKSTITHSFSLL
jgi:hypothetical protein